MTYRNYMYPVLTPNYNHTTLKLAKLSAGFDSKYYPFFYDAFGFIDEDCKFLDIPKKSNKNLIDACIERAKELDGCNLMFSGGVDSTFILACFKAAGADVKLYNYSPEKIILKPELKQYVQRNFKTKYIKDRIKVARLEKVYLGSLADTFFSSSSRLKGARISNRTVDSYGNINYSFTYKDIPFTPLQDMMLHKLTFDEIEMVLSYAKLMDVPLDTNNHIARFIDWITCLPKYMMQASWGYFCGMESFFNTQDFADIAYSQYWESNETPWLNDKKIFKEFIADTLGSDFGVTKNYT